MAQPREVSILIPTVGRLDLLQECVTSFQSHRYRHTYEIHVLDVSSGEESGCREWAQLHECYASVLPGATFAEANNFLANCVDGRIIVLMNDDIVSPTPWLDNLVDPEISANIVGGRLVYPPLDHAYSLIQSAGIGFDVLGNPYSLFKGAPPTHPLAMSSRTCVAVTFALTAIEHAMWVALEGLDTQFRNGYEDIDFCLRARENGAVVSYDPRAKAYHKESQSAGRYDNEDANKALFNQKWVESGRLNYVTGVWPFQPGG